MNFFFFRYVSNFNSRAHGVEVMLTQMVKVQFPDLHEQFKMEKAFIIMASKIRDVLEIEPVESYVKRPTRLMIMVEIKGINRLVGHICILSMAECATPKDTILQKILYSSLPNQCKKCCHFGHFTNACTISKALIWDESTLTGKLPT
jgi:hypothetical protein